MTFYCGIDLHSNNSVVVVINENGEIVKRKKLDNILSDITDFLEQSKNDMAGVVVESTFNWYWLFDGLLEHGFKVHLANTTAIQQYDGMKHSDDNTDARWLAEMLRLDILPTGYICPKKDRAIRDLLRKRMQLVQNHTKHLLSIQGAYQMHLGQ